MSSWDNTHVSNDSHSRAVFQVLTESESILRLDSYAKSVRRQVQLINPAPIFARLEAERCTTGNSSTGEPLHEESTPSPIDPNTTKASMTTQTSEDDETPAFELTEKDRQNLARNDVDFQPHTWENLKQIIATNDLESLRHWPSDLKRYLQWTRTTKETYGNIINYICKERLHWDSLPTPNPDEGPTFEVANPIPFADQRDFKILYNDWPYGMTSDITHIVVWLKNRLPVDDEEGDLTPEARKLVEGFVERSLVSRVQKEGGKGWNDRVMWFRNWTGLQSVRGLDHLHVLVRGVQKEIIDEWTGGRTPFV